MAQQQTTSSNQTTAPSSSSLPNLYPPLDSKIAELDVNERNLAIVRREKELVSCLKEVFNNKNILDGVIDRSIVPAELLVSNKKIFRPKIDPLKRLKDLNPEKEEAEEEEEDEDEEETIELFKGAKKCGGPSGVGA